MLLIDALALDHRDLRGRPAPGKRAELQEAHEDRSGRILVGCGGGLDRQAAALWPTAHQKGVGEPPGELERGSAWPATNSSLMRASWALEDPRRLRFVLGSAALTCAALALLLASVPASAAGAGPGFSAHGSVGQVYVTGLSPKQPMTLVNSSGQVVSTRPADAQGGLLFRNVNPGTGYRVRPAGGGPTSGPLRVLSTRPAPPSTDVYNQSIKPQGYQYLTTRDGTKLAIDVHPPQDVTNAGGVTVPAAPSGPTRR